VRNSKLEKKRDLIKLLDRTGAPDNSWLYCLKCLSGLHNCTALEKLGWITPTQKSTGIPADIYLFIPSTISTSLFIIMLKKTTVFHKQKSCWAIGGVPKRIQERLFVLAF